MRLPQVCSFNRGSQKIYATSALIIILLFSNKLSISAKVWDSALMMNSDYALYWFPRSFELPGNISVQSFAAIVTVSPGKKQSVSEVEVGSEVPAPLTDVGVTYKCAFMQTSVMLVPITCSRWPSLDPDRTLCHTRGSSCPSCILIDLS